MPQFGNNPYQNPQMNQMGQGGQWNRQQAPQGTQGGGSWWGGNQQSAGGQGGWNNTQPNQGAWNKPQPNQQSGGMWNNAYGNQQVSQPTTGYGNYIPPTTTTPTTGDNPQIDPIDTTTTTDVTTTQTNPAFNTVYGFQWLDNILGAKKIIDEKAGTKELRNTGMGYYWQEPAIVAKQQEKFDKYTNIANEWLEDQFHNVYGGDKEAMMNAMNEYWNSTDHNFGYSTYGGGESGLPEWDVKKYGYLSDQGISDKWREQNQEKWDYMQDLLGGIWGQ